MKFLFLTVLPPAAFLAGATLTLKEVKHMFNKPYESIDGLVNDPTLNDYKGKRVSVKGVLVHSMFSDGFVIECKKSERRKFFSINTKKMITIFGDDENYAKPFLEDAKKKKFRVYGTLENPDKIIAKFIEIDGTLYTAYNCV